MKTRVKMLKVKIKSLAEEARIIRREELRALGWRLSPTKRKDMGKGYVQRNPNYYVIKYRDAALHEELRNHRVGDVRREQRVSLLAYAFLRNKTLAACEPHHISQQIDWTRVLSLVLKFGPVKPVETKVETEAKLKEWRTAVPASV